jgi:predicted Zn-dependent peptidase
LKSPVKDEELSKAKNMVLSDYVESLKTNDGKAKILAMNEILLGDYREFFRDIDRYLKVSQDDLSRVKSYLALNKTISVVVDKEGK